jgi:hypothetical protein
MPGISSSSFTAIIPNSPVTIAETPFFSIVNGGTPPGQKFTVACTSNVQIHFAGYINITTEDTSEVVNIWLRIAGASGNMDVSPPQTVRAEPGKVVTVTPVQVANLGPGTYYSQILVSKDSLGTTDTATIEGELSILVTSSVL